MNILHIVVTAFLFLGVAAALLSSIGLLRFGDVYMRMHATTKSNALGMLFILSATALYFGDPLITIKLIALFVVYFFTTPVGTQVLSHAAHFAGVPMVKETWVDKLAEAEAPELIPAKPKEVKDAPKP
jgi:multicomponent Na+:H+ antiporter subunit G